MWRGCFGGNVKKFMFKNCGSVFSIYFYDVCNIGYSCVLIIERKGSVFFRWVFLKCDGFCDRVIYDICLKNGWRYGVLCE